MYVAIDIGGTKTEIAVFKTLDAKFPQDSQIFPTPNQYSECLNQLQIFLRKLIGNQPIQGVGVSIASRLSSDYRLSSNNNLPDYRDQYLDRDLVSLLHCPVFIQNDATCAALAEITYGTGQNAQSLIHFILGTGFGGTYIKLSNHSLSVIPLEPGHTIIQPGGMSHTHHSTKGLFESYLGGGQLEAQLNQPLSLLSDDHRIWNQVAGYLTMAVFNFSMLFNPELMTFSGSLIQNRPFLLDLVKAKLINYPDLTVIPPLNLTTMAKNASLRGALALIK